jgi:hypothetical protein
LASRGSGSAVDELVWRSPPTGSDVADERAWLAHRRPRAEGPVPREASARFWPPGSTLSFLGSEWVVELGFGPPHTSIVSAAALGLSVTPLPLRFADSPLCMISDPGGKLVLIPCWELFRFYYAQMPAVARLVLEFPRWTEETLERLLSFFDGHRFKNSVARPSVPSLLAATQLRAIGRDAAVSFARRGRIQIRAVPPFTGPTTLEVVGHPTMSVSMRPSSSSKSLSLGRCPRGSRRSTGGPSRLSPPSARTSSTWPGG